MSNIYNQSFNLKKRKIDQQTAMSVRSDISFTCVLFNPKVINEFL